MAPFVPSLLRPEADETGAGSPDGAAPPGCTVVLKRILGERGPTVWRSGQREVHFGREVLRLASLTVGREGPDGSGFDHLVSHTGLGGVWTSCEEGNSLRHHVGASNDI